MRIERCSFGAKMENGRELVAIPAPKNEIRGLNAQDYFHSPKHAVVSFFCNSLKRQPKIEAPLLRNPLSTWFCTTDVSETDCFVTDMFHFWQNNLFYCFETLNDLPRIVGTDVFQIQSVFLFRSRAFTVFLILRVGSNSIVLKEKYVQFVFSFKWFFGYLNYFVTVTVDNCELFVLATIGIIGIVHE